MKILNYYNNHSGKLKDAFSYFGSILKFIEENTWIKRVGEYNGKDAEMLPIQDYIAQNLNNHIIKNIDKKYLNDNNINSSRVGYDIHLMGITQNGIKCIIKSSFGTPHSASRDGLLISFDYKMFKTEEDLNSKEDFKKLIELFKFIILRTNPIVSIIKDYHLGKEVELSKSIVGYYTYIRNLEKEKIKTSDFFKIYDFSAGAIIKCNQNIRISAIEEIKKLYTKNKIYLDLNVIFG